MGDMKTFDNPVAFTAALSQSFYDGGDDAIIPFDYSLLNHGDAFEYVLLFLSFL